MSIIQQQQQQQQQLPLNFFYENNSFGMTAKDASVSFNHATNANTNTTIFSRLAIIDRVVTNILEVTDSIIAPPGENGVFEVTTDNTGTRVVRYNIAAGGGDSLTNNTTFLVGAQNIGSPGKSVMWYSHASAFRVGRDATGTHWNIPNLGNNSFASGENNIASGEQAVTFGEGNTNGGENSAVLSGASNSISSLSTACTIASSEATSILANSMDVTVLSCNTAAVQLTNGAVIGGTDVLVGANAGTGTITGAIGGSVGMFDSSQDGQVFMETSNQLKTNFQGGFVRAGGSKAFDSDGISTSVGNDGAREVMLPFRMRVLQGTTKSVLIPIKLNHIMNVRGTMVISGVTLGQRAVFEFNNLIVTNNIGTVTVDVLPTVTQYLSIPENLFSVYNFIFSASLSDLVITVDPPANTDITVNMLIYFTDLMLN